MNTSIKVVVIVCLTFCCFGFVSNINLERVQGKVLQITGKHELLFLKDFCVTRISSRGNISLGNDGTVIYLVGIDTENIVDEEYLDTESFRDGTFEYFAVDGSKKKVAKYVYFGKYVAPKNTITEQTPYGMATRKVR